MMLTMMILRYRSKQECFATVTAVNDDLEKKGLHTMCKKQQVKSAEECNVFQEDSKLKSRDEYLDLQLDDCARYIEDTKVEYNEVKEKETPLAFSIMAHKDANQLSKLISAIFRPWNSYCLQLDSKSSPQFTQLVTKLVHCYTTVHRNSTVFLSLSSLSLVWQHSSLLEGDLACLEQLSRRNSDWQYFVNVVGSEYPLITNYQLVNKLSAVKNDVGFVHSVFPWPEVQARWKYSHRLPEDGAQDTATSLFGGYYRHGPYKTDHLKSSPPLNLTIMYGIKNVAITRDFAYFVLHSHVAQVLRDWLQDTLVAVEHFFSTLATVKVDHKGHISQDFDQLEHLNWFRMRKTFWHQEFKTCHGQVKREICNLAFGDLPYILEQKSFVVNKFDTELDPSVVDCLRYWVYGSE
eukprot:GFUD01004341.1.p1 GENE.GFUD01004341.1~~GFUD01004341.1.p1  ORF type:complete len:406 (-),score=130.77 GFUD01004341.1:4-1221(-)